MAINKAKVLESAQKYVTQGKLKEAINEYKKVIQEDPKDLNCLNTLGDLYVRLNNLPEALQYFARLADIYVSDGFLVRGIAMYKKIAKLDPAHTTALERLAELYTMQGLFTEARSQYLQLVETYLKANQAPEAINILQKVLDLEPDNLAIQQRLAQLYQEHGRKQEAATIYRRVAERLLNREQVDDSLKWLQKAAQLSPENPEVLLLVARLHAQQGRAADAVEALQKVPKLTEYPEALELLLQCQLTLGEADAAGKLALDIFNRDPSQFGGLLQLADHALAQGAPDRAFDLLQQVAAPALEHGEGARLAASLRRVVEASESLAAAELLESVARKADDRSSLIVALERLAADACQKEDFTRAKQAYEELLELEPGRPEFAQELNQVRKRLGMAVEEEVTLTTLARERLEEPPWVAGTEVAAGEAEPAAVAEAELDAETQAYVSSSLTDIDLFSSYGMSQKAIELAEQAVARVPGHILLNQKLLDLYLGCGNDEGVATVAQRLAELYRQKGDVARANEVARVAEHYQAKLPAPPPAAEVEAVREVDLSAEWAELTEAAPPAAEEEVVELAPAAVPGFNAAEVQEEVNFYIEQEMLNEARLVLERYEEQFPGEPVLADLRQRLEEALAAKAPAAAEVELAEEEVAEVATAEEQAPAEVAAAPAEGTYEIVLEEVPKEAPKPALTADQLMAELAEEVEAVLPEPVAPAAPPAPAPAPEAPAEGVAALTEVFDEFKQELGEVEEVEDIETHYNLGIAFKEMELLDEAISEFQKAFKTAEKQKAHPSLIQCCTLLGLCFMAKGMPQVAVRWYERALAVPGLDTESATALRYDLGLAHEQAGNPKAALDCFLEVYGVNIDFRDVSERIRLLQQ